MDNAVATGRDRKLAGPGDTPRVRFDAISRRYGTVQAVDSVDLSLGSREILCLLGPSGCGKTTLMRIAAGLERQSSGRIIIDGREVAGPSRFDPPEARGVGFMFQDFALFPHLTVLDNVAFGLTDLDPGKSARLAAEALDRVGLSNLGASFPHTLSGGEQQRAALARAIAPRPNVLFMDEPFSGLDRSLRESVRDDTLTILAETGAASILVTHDPEEAMQMADRIALMRKGRLVQVGTPHELYFSPVDARTAAFFSDVNVLEGVVRDGHVDTAVGRIGAGSLAEGAKTVVLVREHGLSFSDDAGRDAQIIATRFVGEVTRIDLVVYGYDRKLRVRLPGQTRKGPGDNVKITADPALTFVFEAPC